MPKTKAQKQGQISKTKKEKKLSGAPLAVTRHMSQLAPRVQGGGRSIRIVHREFFSVASSYQEAVPPGETEVNTVWAWTIQPGWSTLFPWLSRIAGAYEKYRFNSIRFEFIPRVPATTPGTLVMALDQDPSDPLPTEDEQGRVVMMTHQGAVAGCVWEDLSMPYPGHWIEAKERFIRAPGDTRTIEPRTADMGVLFVGLFGVQNLKVFGDLVVSYDISLVLPQFTIPPVESGTSVFIAPSAASGGYHQSELPFENFAGSIADVAVQAQGAIASDLEASTSTIAGTERVLVRYKGKEPIASDATFGGIGILQSTSVTPAAALAQLRSNSKILVYGADEGECKLVGEYPLEFNAAPINSGSIAIDGFVRDLQLKTGQSFLIRLANVWPQIVKISNVLLTLWSAYSPTLSGTTCRTPRNPMLPRAGVATKRSIAISFTCSDPGSTTPHDRMSEAACEPRGPERPKTTRGGL